MYIAPDGSLSATYPSILRRLGAGAIDWLICWVVCLIASIVAGIIQGVGETSLDAGDAGTPLGVTLVVLSQLIVAAAIVAYFAFYWAQGSTLGMRALDFELVREATGRPPSWRRTVPRGVLACLVALAVLNVYLASSGRPEDDPFNTFERALIGASVTVAVVGLAAKAFILVDPRRRSLFDVLFRLVYLEEFVFAHARPSPWTEDIR
ncbi:MAG: RDD family protein [Gaiellaceae bacterium]